MPIKGLKILRYPGDATSFQPVIESTIPQLKGEGALLVIDALPKAELIVRQYLRAGVDPARALLTTTGEGAGPRALGPEHAALEGVLVSPIAGPGPDTSAFEAAFRAQQGEDPSDQAYLVFRALASAAFGQPPRAEATLHRVEGGRLGPPRP